MGLTQTTRRATETLTFRLDGAHAPIPARFRIGKVIAGTAGGAIPKAPEPTKQTAAYQDFANAFADDLAPRGPVQTFLAERAASCAWRLKRMMAADPHRGGGDAAAEGNEEAAEGALYKALEALAEMQAAQRAKTVSSYGEPAPADSKAGSVAPELVHFDSYCIESTDKPTDFTLTWKDRLTFDESICSESPVVRGTSITVRHVVSRIVDGWTWAGLLQAHPELTPADLRACVVYSAEFENASLDRYRGAMDRAS